jgi:hypothetical protein
MKMVFFPAAINNTFSALIKNNDKFNEFNLNNNKYHNT